MICLLSLVLAATAAPSKIAVMDVSVRAGVPASLVPSLTENIVSEVRRRRPQSGVVSADEIRDMLAVQGQRQRLGCRAGSDVACLAEIGGALGAERLLIGALSKIGKTYVLSLKIVDVARAKVLQSASVNLPTREEDDLLAAATKLTDQLFPALPPAVVQLMPTPAGLAAPPALELPTAQVTAPEPGHHSRLPAVLIGVAGLGAGAVAIYGLTRILAYNADVQTVNGGGGGATGLNYAKFQSEKTTAQRWQFLGLGLGALAVAGLTTAVIVW